MSLADKYFKEEVNKLLTEGFNDKDFPVRPVWVNDDGSTEPAHTIKTFGVLRSYDLSKEFPILTLRTQPFKTAVKEVIWMWVKKSNNIKDLDAHIWDAWADEDGSIGKTYSYQLAQKDQSLYRQIGIPYFRQNSFVANQFALGNQFFHKHTHGIFGDVESYSHFFNAQYGIAFKQVKQTVFHYVYTLKI